MLLIDLSIVALTLAAAYVGYLRGLSTGALAIFGFGVGAVAGSRLAPQVLDGGLRDPFAPVLALPAAVLLGAVLAVGFDHFGHRMMRRLGRFELLDGIGGAVLAGCLGLVVAWIAGAAIARIDSLEDPVRDSAILDRLNAVLPAPGPLLEPELETEDLPTIAGPPPGVPRADPDIVRDDDVRTAARSMVKILGLACGRAKGGSGWVVRPGLVVTNAHVVAGEKNIEVQVRGLGEGLEATPIWFDEANDLALLRVPALAGVRPLQINRKVRAGISAAMIGFPHGKFDIESVRVGRAYVRYIRASGEDRAVRASSTSFRGEPRPGNSGGPIVDRQGRVVATVFAGREPGGSGYAVSNTALERALRGAKGPVGTGDCD